MGRLESIRAYVDRIVGGIDDGGRRAVARAHADGASVACGMIAQRRGLDAELASVCGLLHDIYRCRTGIAAWHAQSGAEMARPVIRDMGGFTPGEQTLILSAVFHHSDLSHTHDAYDEVLKDALALQAFRDQPNEKVSRDAVARLARLSPELGVALEPSPSSMPAEPCGCPSGCIDRLADIAERMAGGRIQGVRDDARFADLIRYWPEESAFDELSHRWCAAFVYHCCMLAGIALPIRHPLSSCRFAAVAAWYEWATLAGYSFQDENGFMPRRGDILIYDNVISPENKEPESPWHDHIGIVLSCERDIVTVAEGNVNNANTSGILERRRSAKLGCYVRIPAGYTYNGWKYDYKTHSVRVSQSGVEANDSKVGDR